MTGPEIVRELAERDIDHNIPQRLDYYAQEGYGPFDDEDSRKAGIEAARKVLKRAGIYRRPRKPDFMDKLEDLHNRQLLNEQYEPRSYSVEFNYPSKPLLKMHISDLHLGARGVDYTYIQNILNIVKENSFIDVCLLGDLYDNYLHFKSLRGSNDSLVGPSIQVELAAELIRDLDSTGQLDYVTLGNHSVEREERAVGYSVLKKILPLSIRERIFETTAVVRYNIGIGGNQISYTGIVSHRGKGNSSKNPAHAAMELIRAWSGVQADFSAVGHYHSPAASSYTEGGREVVAIRCGSPYVDDIHSKRFYTDPIPGCPCLVFNHRIKEIVPFMNIHQAIRYYKSLKG